MELLSQSTDQELIKLFIAGNANAFDNLVLRHQQTLYTAILLLVKDRFMAEDILQNTFIKIITSLKEGRYNEEGKFFPWALRIARNQSIDHIRKLKQSLPRITPAYQNILGNVNFYEQSAEMKMIQFQSHCVLQDMLNELPEDQRVVIILRHYKDMSYKEIALHTNCTVNTALGRMRYGLIKLRKMLLQKQIVLQ